MSPRLSSAKIIVYMFGDQLMDHIALKESCKPKVSVMIWRCTTSHGSGTLCKLNVI